MKKSQIAFEHLAAYMVAIMFCIVAITALAYFGVFNYNKFLPSSCILIPGLSCDSHVVKSDGSASIVVRNGIGFDMVNMSLTLNNVSSNAGIITLGDGKTQRFDWSAGSIIAGEKRRKFHGDVMINYTDKYMLHHAKIGKITTEVET